MPAHVAPRWEIAVTDEEILLAAGFDHVETRFILQGVPRSLEVAVYVLQHGAGPEDERALAVVRRLMGKGEA